VASLGFLSATQLDIVIMMVTWGINHLLFRELIVDPKLQSYINYVILCGFLYTIYSRSFTLIGIILLCDFFIVSFAVNFHLNDTALENFINRLPECFVYVYTDSCTSFPKCLSLFTASWLVPKSSYSCQ